MIEKISEQDKVIAILSSIPKGKSVIYYIGQSFWLGAPDMKRAYNYIQEHNKKGTFSFMQRVRPDGLTEYIALRRLVPEPSFYLDEEE